MDITCGADGTYNKKMMFKYSGTSHLDEPGSYVATSNCYSWWHSLNVVICSQSFMYVCDSSIILEDNNYYSLIHP